MDENRPIDRLLEYLAAKGIKLGPAEKLAGLSNGYLKNATLRNGEIASDTLRKLEKAFVDLNLIYIVNGSGEMLTNGISNDDTRTTSNRFADQKEGYKASTPTDYKQVPERISKKSAPATAPPTTILTPRFITVDNHGNENILHVPVRAQAGYLTSYGDQEYIERLPTFSLPGLNKGSYRSFEIEGDSMHPTLKNGQMIIGEWIEKLEYIRDGRVYVLVTKTQGVLVKRVLNRVEKHGLIICKSDALDKRNLYPNIVLKPDEIQEIWYGVFHGGFEFQEPSDHWKRLNYNEADITVLKNTVAQLSDLILKAGLLKS